MGQTLDPPGLDRKIHNRKNHDSHTPEVFSHFTASLMDDSHNAMTIFVSWSHFKAMLLEYMFASSKVDIKTLN